MLRARYATTVSAIFVAFLCCVPSALADDHADLAPSHSVKPELYATGFEFSEGPALDREGNLFVVNEG